MKVIFEIYLRIFKSKNNIANKQIANFLILKKRPSIYRQTFKICSMSCLNSLQNFILTKQNKQIYKKRPKCNN